MGANARQTLGRYQYVGNNPATSRDLLGYQVPRMTMGGSGGFTPKRAVAPPRHPSSGGGSGPSVYSPSIRLEALSARHRLDASSIALPLAGLGTRVAVGGAAAGTTAAAGSATLWWTLLGRLFGGAALGVILSTSGDSSHAAEEAADRKEAQTAAKPAAVSTPATPPQGDCEIS